MISYNTTVVLAGSALLGAGSGVIGSFAVLRRRALTGDALSHATLPGLGMAFLILGQRSLPAMLFGAFCTGVLGVAVISALRRWTRIKEDAAIGIVLGVFFGAGIALSGVIQRLVTAGSKAGLDSFIFGKTAGMTAGDVYLIAGMSAVCVLLVSLLYKEFKLTVFDAGFAAAQGWPVWRLDLLLMSLVAVVVVIGLPAVGAILMAALLILPAAAARFWTDRLGVMLLLSGAFGMTMGLVGTWISVQVNHIPTGPIIVVSGSTVFLISMLFAPRRGAIARGIGQWQFRRRLARGQLQFDPIVLEDDDTLTDRLAGFDEIALGATSPAAHAESTADPKTPSASLSKPAAMLVRSSNPWTFDGVAWFVGFAILALSLFACWWNSLPVDDRPLVAWTIAIGCLVNIPCAILGCYLVLRQMSLLGDAISHAVLPGIVLAFLLTGQITGWPILLGAMAFGLLTAFLTHALKDLGRVPEDSSMGIVYTTLFSVGVILVSQFAAGAHLDVDCILYGLLDFVALDTIKVYTYEVPRVLPTMLAMCVVVVFFVALFWKELKLSLFDAGLATAMGLNAVVIHYLLMAVVAGVTVTAFEAIGSILVIAMLIVPAATAQLLTDRLGPMIFCAIVAATLAAIFGYMGARLFNTNVSAMMAVAAGMQFALAVILAPRYGLASKWWRNLSLSMRIAGEDLIAMLYRAEEALQRGEPKLAASIVAERQSVGGLAARLAVRRLRRRGNLRLADGGDLALTDSGREMARSIIRSHRLWETYLGEQTDLPLDHLHAPAERMEHFIGRSLQDQLAASVSAGDVDPHGRAIPAEKSGSSPA